MIRALRRSGRASILCVGGVKWCVSVYLDGEPVRLWSYHAGVRWTLEENKRGMCVLSFAWRLESIRAPMRVIVAKTERGRADFDEAFAVVSSITPERIARLAAVQEILIGEHLREASR